MGIALKIVQKDFRRRLKNPLSMILFILFPVLLCLIIGLAFNPVRKGSLPTTKILIADLDKDFLSGLLKNAFRSSSAEAPRVELREVSEAEGRRAIAEGEASALLIIPEDFSDDYFEGKPIRLTLVKNPSQAILPEVAEQYADILALLASYVSRFFESELSVVRRFADRESLWSRLEWNAMGIGLYDKLETVEKYLFPVPISIEEPKEKETKEGGKDAKGASSAQDSRRSFNIYKYILPGLAIFGIFFLAQMSFREIYTERSQGTLARLLTSPVSVEAFLLGKALSAFLITLCGLVLLQLVGYFGLGVDWGPPIFVLALDLVAILGMSGVCLLIFSLARTQAQGESILTAVILFMALFGGSFVPLAVLPPFFKRITDFTLNGNIIAGFNSLLFDGRLLPVWPRLLGISAVGLAAFLAGSVLLRRGLRRRL